MTATSKKLQQGLSLVEILVALLISIFLLGGIIQVYIGNKAAYRFSDTSARIQEHGRFALETITNDTRLAGFYGCVDIRKRLDLVQNHLNDDSDHHSDEVHGFAKQPPISVTAGAAGGSDEFTIRGSRPGQAVFDETLPKNTTGAIKVRGDTVFQAGDIVLITNCITSDIFEATSVSRSGDVTTINHSTDPRPNTPGNKKLTGTTCTGSTGHCFFGGMTLKGNKTMEEHNNTHLEEGYQKDSASAYLLQTVSYRIAPSASDDSIPALWRSLNGKDEELIDGVERMNVLFGLDDDIDDEKGDDSPKQYFPASKITSEELRNRVTAIRVSLIVRSEDDFVLDKSQTYTYMGATITANDRRQRQVFTSTIDLRNR